MTGKVNVTSTALPLIRPGLHLGDIETTRTASLSSDSSNPRRNTHLVHSLGNPLAQPLTTFGPMNPHEPIFVAPPITEIPDYVWSPRYDRPSWIPGRPVKKPKDTSKRIPHPDAESALQAAKKACRGNTGRWFGRAPEGPTAFWVYEGNKVVERHVSSALPIGPHPPIG